MRLPGMMVLLTLLGLPTVSLAAQKGATAEPPPPPPAVSVAPAFIPDAAALKVPPPEEKLAYSVVIENRSGGIIRVVDPPAQFLLARPGVDLGTVVRPATHLNTESFHASLWGGAMTVVASAANALHIKAYDQPGLPRAAVITLVPEELLTHELDGSSAVLRDDQIYTDIAGGHGIFGGSYPVIVGNPVSVYRNRQHVDFGPQSTALEIGDIIIIEVRTPADWPKELTLDNHKGGDVVLTSKDGSTVECGAVEKPVSGTGRFSGGIFCESGGIRATHTGVLDIDFSPRDQTGGMQIIPHAHSLSPELTYSQDSPPYGILAGPLGSDLRGQAPLFSGYLYPQSGLEPSAKLPRLLVSVKFRDYTLRGGSAVDVEQSLSPWLPLPLLVGREDLSDLTAVRVEWVLPAPAAPTTTPTPPAPPPPLAPPPGGS
jgi:hypothetical protein